MRLGVSAETFSVRLGTAIQLARASVQKRGVRATVQRLRRLVVQREKARRKAHADVAFDKERRVDTAAWVRVPELDTDSPTREHAVRYQPSSVEEFALLMGKLPIDCRDFTFVDYGSGKGRVLLLAAEYPFKRIVGVEFAKSLNEIARENIATLGDDASRVTTVLADATMFDPPPEPLVLYFFHPFSGPVLEQVLARIRSSLERTPRPAYLVLTGPPEFAQAVEQAGFDRVDVEELERLTRGVFAAPASLAG